MSCLSDTSRHKCCTTRCQWQQTHIWNAFIWYFNPRSKPTIFTWTIVLYIWVCIFFVFYHAVLTVYIDLVKISKCITFAKFFFFFLLSNHSGYTSGLNSVQGTCHWWRHGECRTSFLWNRQCKFLLLFMQITRLYILMFNSDLNFVSPSFTLHFLGYSK